MKRTEDENSSRPKDSFLFIIVISENKQELGRRGCMVYLLKPLLVMVILFSLSACSIWEKNERQVHSPPSTVSDIEKLPIKIDQNIIERINWEVSPVFQSGNCLMRGVPNKVGFIDAPFTANQGNKYMWHFWGDSIPEGKLTIVAVKKGSNDVAPALTVDGKSVWTTSVPGSPNNGADAHIPSNMKLRESGTWALLIYLGNTYWDYVVIDVH
ncbi:DUF4871 domain-containing protein [Geobacillus thermodenitrificans]|uniref:DUF4871 domain-containing protein n=2 Tax=Geobacillus TaxID=129337 RepID=UPI000C05C1A5|nr:DUF4871 domain-containing protein [Geobacillus thermodenitrificans]ATO36311.1 DUF4871 domain-containing protein [Geobacillus thermodenitrificans]PTR48495.1 DUF4871 domain-containing protein [Geobacillus thermodenitrificans]